jgi:hypothetical protein
MAIWQAGAFPSNSTDALFRAWATVFSAGLDAIGMTKTADTGQINLATVLAPTAISTFTGYEIRSFTDGNANAVSFKIEYGSAAGLTNTPSIRIQFGGGSNGTGTLTGSTSTLSVLSLASNSAVLTHQLWVSGTASWFTLGVMAVNSTVASIGISAARSKDSTGADTATAINICMAGTVGTLNRGSEWLPAAGGGSKNTSSTYLSGFPNSGTSASGSTGVGVWIIQPNISNTPQNFDLGTLIGFAVDFGSSTAGGNTLTKSYYSIAHTYVSCGPIGSSTFNGNASTSPTLFFRYE